MKDAAMKDEVVIVKPILLDVIQVAAALSVSDRFIRSQVFAGQFPRPVKWGRLSRWRAADIEKWAAELGE
jgi:predicted DNA-binding transcriptional regulator AlpA